MIDGSICDVASESSTEIVCYTNYHAGAIKAPVVVDVPDQGYAVYSDPDAAVFYYIDRWSSIWTWGGLGTPLKDEFIVITEGQTILLDVSTPVLAFLLIKGGTLVFDSENTFIELQSKYILLVEGGKLQIGSEEVHYPQESKAIITMVHFYPVLVQFEYGRSFVFKLPSHSGTCAQKNGCNLKSWDSAGGRK